MGHAGTRNMSTVGSMEVHETCLQTGRCVELYLKNLFRSIVSWENDGYNPGWRIVFRLIRQLLRSLTFKNTY